MILLVFLLAVLLTLASPSLGFQQRLSPLSAALTEEIDISEVLAETEAALVLAQQVLPSSGIEEERADLSQLQREILKSNGSKKLTLGAIMSSALDLTMNEFASQLGNTIEFTKEQFEEEKDPTKIPGKVVWNLGEQANRNLKEFRSSNQQFAEDIKTGKVWDNFVDFLRSDELKESSEQLRDVSVSTYSVIKASLESDEFHQMQNKAVKAMKDGIEAGLKSDEFQQLQSKASASIQNKLSGPTDNKRVKE